jgi:hypothetical protein
MSLLFGIRDPWGEGGYAWLEKPKYFTFARLVHTEKALPGSNNLAEGSQDELV